MHQPQPPRRYSFGIFQLDTATGELRRKGIRIKLHAQPFQILTLLLERPGQMLTREEICRELWPEGTFVDYEHGVNSAINRLRAALGDTAGNPRFVETVARRGYRFLGPVQRIEPAEPIEPVVRIAPTEPAAAPANSTPEPRPIFLGRILAAPADLPRIPHATVQALFVLLQLMYLGFYLGALCNLPEINDLLSPLPFAPHIFTMVAATAALLIPVRIFLLSAVLFHAPGLTARFLRLWWFLLPLDILWALAPFLLLHHIPLGLALACTAPLVYSPFAQRSLILMGAGSLAHKLASSNTD